MQDKRATFTYPILVLVAVSLTGTVLNRSTSTALEHSRRDDYVSGEPGDRKQPFRGLELAMWEADGSTSFFPTEVEVKKGEQIMLILQNVGNLPHDFFIGQSQRLSAPKLENYLEVEADVTVQSILPGQQIKLLWKFSRTGTFVFACPISGNNQNKMRGKIVVE
jgi:uncharacterized cupredoxin-like copper-binding protein